MDYLLANVTVRFVEDEKIPTAAIKLSGEAEILIGKKFWEKHILSYRDAIAVLTHELLHQISFSENSLSRRSHLDNFAQDMWINSYISRHFSLSDFFERFYRVKIPYFLLRSPYGIRPERKKKLAEKTLPGKPHLQMQLLSLWENTYGDKQPGATTIKTHLIRIFGRELNFAYIDLPIVSSLPASRKIKEELSEAIKIKLDAREERYSNDVRSFSLADELTESRVSGIVRAKGISELISEIMKLFRDEGTIKYRIPSKIKLHGVIPRPGRRDLISIARGGYPLFYENEEVLPSIEFKDTGIYIDLSGSMEEFYGDIYFLMLKLSQHISPPYFTFSTTIEEIPSLKLNHLNSERQVVQILKK